MSSFLESYDFLLAIAEFLGPQEGCDFLGALMPDRWFCYMEGEFLDFELGHCGFPCDGHCQTCDPGYQERSRYGNFDMSDEV